MLFCFFDIYPLIAVDVCKQSACVSINRSSALDPVKVLTSHLSVSLAPAIHDYFLNPRCHGNRAWHHHSQPNNSHSLLYFGVRLKFCPHLSCSKSTSSSCGSILRSIYCPMSHRPPQNPQTQKVWMQRMESATTAVSLRKCDLNL